MLLCFMQQKHILYRASNVHWTFSLHTAAFAGSSPLVNLWNQKTVAFATVIDSMVAGEGLVISGAVLFQRSQRLDAFSSQLFSPLFSLHASNIPFYM